MLVRDRGGSLQDDALGLGQNAVPDLGVGLHEELDAGAMAPFARSRTMFKDDKRGFALPAAIGGLVAVHQFCRIGAYSYIGGVSGVGLDVPPYVIVAGIRDQTRVSGINKVGLRRSGFSRDVISNLDSVFRTIYRSPNLLLKDALELVKKEYPDCGEVQHMIDFFETSKRGVIRRTEV